MKKQIKHSLLLKQRLTKQQFYALLFLAFFAFSFGIQQANFFSPENHNNNVTANERLADSEIEREAQDLPLLFVNANIVTLNVLSYYSNAHTSFNSAAYVVSFVRPFLRAPPSI